MSETIMRQFQMLKLIPRLGNITAQELQKQLEDYGFETTERTVQRDLIHLSSIFTLECDDRAKPHGWSWSPDTVAFDLAGLSVPEALAFQMLSQLGKDLLPAPVVETLTPYFNVARRQLDAEIGARPVKNWMRKVRAVAPNQPLLTARIPEKILAAVHDALMHDRCLRIQYRAEDGKSLVVHPLGLVQHGATFYLVVNYAGFKDVSLLAVHRVRTAEVLDEKIQTPEGFCLDKTIADGALGFGEVGSAIRLEIKMYNHAGDHLQETPLSADQQIVWLAPGEARITATLQLTRRLRWWLRGFAGDVEVIKPVALRREMISHLEKAQARYQP